MTDTSNEPLAYEPWEAAEEFDDEERQAAAEQHPKTVPQPFSDDEWGSIAPSLTGHPDTASVACTGLLLARLAVTVDALRAQRDDPRHIADPNDRCPECGGYGLRGCGSIWHDGRPDTHCSTVCQCRTDDRALIRELAAERDAAREDRVCWRETHNQVAAERDALRSVVRLMADTGDTAPPYLGGGGWTPRMVRAYDDARRALDARPTEGNPE